MRRFVTGVAALLALLVAGCAVRAPAGPVTPAGGGTPAPAAPSTPAEPSTPAAPPAPALVAEGPNRRLTGLGSVDWLQWAPGGRTALVVSANRLYAVRLDTPQLQPLPDLQAMMMPPAWVGPDEVLLGKRQGMGVVSLLTGEWRPLAQVPGRIRVCPSGDAWVLVDVQAIRDGGAGSREMGPVYRGPGPWRASRS